MTTSSTRTPRLRAAGAAIALVLFGALLGITVDRLLHDPGPVAQASLTADAMAARLGLAAEDEARLRALVDTLNTEVLAAMAEGPDALLAATHAAHLRIEASLPEEARTSFHAWMREQHRQMMHHMEGMHPGMGGMHGTGAN